MITRPSRHAAWIAFGTGLALHTVMALWTWKTWGYFGRGNVVTWMDFPISLGYLHLEGDAMLWSSLIAGGLQWGAISALLALLVGRTLRRRA